jgi:hypothetical protein
MIADSFTRRLLLSFLVMLTFGAMAASCAGQKAVPQAQPMPAGKNFTGVWYSPQFEHMHLRQTGDKVSGIYTYKTGGRIEGEVDGNILVFDWIEPGNKESAQRTMKGRGYLQLNEGADKTTLDGEWGYNDKVTGAGPWKAEWVRKLEPEDPLTLQNLAESRD